MKRRPSRPIVLITTVVAGLAVATTTAVTPAASGAANPGHYRVGDYANGQAMNILPAGENGMFNAADLALFETTGQRPVGNQDQLAPYANLLYGYHSLTDSGLLQYYNDASFGVKQADIIRTENPGTGVTIFRDTHDVPHIYGTTDAAAAFGAGYAQAEDRLFEMDVLRHYGEGTLASFLGASCAFEQMDHDQLLLAPYTAAQAQAQVDALPAEFGTRGALAKLMIDNYVAGVNTYVHAALTNPTLLPVDYALATNDLLPTDWTDGDVVAVAGLIGGIFGKGGGDEVANSQLLRYLQTQMSPNAAAQAFTDFRAQNDPLAPSTITDQAFPYEIPGKINSTTTAIPDSGKLSGGPVGTDPTCAATPVNPQAAAVLVGLMQLPKHMSNALVVNADHSADGHPVAVFGPQVSYFAPQILSQLDLHAPDYAATGASFPGTGLVELGRGADYAWSATSAGTDVVDQRLEIICNPNGGNPAPRGTYYLFRGSCLPMTNETFSETVLPKPGGTGGPVILNHQIHLTRHGVVQGWTTAGGRPVAVVNQRSTYNHDVDSVVGFLGFADPNTTHDVTSWMQSAAQIDYTFNWFYVDDRDTGYYVSGLDPVRPSNVDPNLPTWGDGRSEWRGFLPADAHPHEVNPPQGFFVSWNNKPAPQFSAADDQYGYGQVYRSIMLVKQLQALFAAHPGGVTRAEVVQAMETAASQDLDGITIISTLLQYLSGHSEPAKVKAMLSQLQAWVAAGSHRLKASPSDTEYMNAAAVAISDELVPRLIRALYDPILLAGGLGSVGSNGGATAVAYSKLPMQFVNTPNGGGAHLGSAYDGGYEGYVVATLQQLMGQSPADGFGAAITTRECAGGPATCAGTIDSALTATYTALVNANGGSTNVASWTASSASAAAGQAMPDYDNIHFSQLGLIGQPPIDWQNRPTFQQVVEFPAHRPRS